MIAYSIFRRLYGLFEEKGLRPTFVSVKPDLDSVDTLMGLMESIGLPEEHWVDEKELHATVTYSRRPIRDPSEIVRGFLPVHAYGDELTFFTSRNEGKQCLVLKLSSVQLHALHFEINKTGASHDFPTYEAHVTLCYDTPAFLIEHIKSLKIRPRPLLFTGYEVKELDLEWKPS